MKTAVLHLHCKDVKGIVYNVSRFIYERGGNIISSQQHREELENQVHTIPEAIDQEIARLKLKLMGIEIDTLTEEQSKYLSSWEVGT